MNFGAHGLLGFIPIQRWCLISIKPKQVPGRTLSGKPIKVFQLG